MRPAIAVIGRRAAHATGLRFSATVAPEALCEAVWAAGGEPLLLHGPAADPTAELADRLERFDGVLLPGGVDLGPDRYGQAPHAYTTDVIGFQDDLDLAAAAVCLERRLPTLAICRGLHAINVACGGTLAQHLPDVTDVDHKRDTHEVALTPGTRLAALLVEPVIVVSTYHHQAVGQLGDGLAVAGRAPDGTIEAVEHETADLVAVQWHPEDLFASSRSDLLLFEDLAARASERTRAVRSR